MPAKRKHDIPYQLLSWHEHVAFTRDEHPHLPYKEVLKLASKTYHSKGSGRRKTVRRRTGGHMEDAHEVAGRRKTVRRHKGGELEDPHHVAGRRRVSHRRGAGVVGSVAHGVASVLDAIGLGRAKPRAKRSAPAKPRGAGPVGSVLRTAANITNLLGLGKAKKPRAKRSAY